MPASGFIAACNANAVVPEFLKTGTYQPQPSIATLSNAMDVGNPSNFVRVLELFDREFEQVKNGLSAVSISDKQTAATMRDVYERFGYVLDPHGAVAFRALEDAGRRGIILETAHPVKFDSVAEILGIEPEVPASVAELFDRPSEKLETSVDQQRLKEIILSKI
jgi:threonine synthase